MKEQISYDERNEGGEVDDSPFNSLQQVKRDFFSLRNGVIADVLKKGGSRFKIIFGLNLPQLSGLAKKYGPDKELAFRLWDNKSTRCSMLLAPMIMPLEAFDMETARKWIDETNEVEVADILCSKLLVLTDFASSLVKELETGDSMRRYVAMRLAMNILKKKRYFNQEWLDLINTEVTSTVVSNRLLATALLEELEFMKDS